MEHPVPDPTGPGQESVWDYPRPPLLEPTTRHVRVLAEGVEVADSHRCLRVLETSHPPTYYVHPGDVDGTHLERSPRSSVCEWKGPARYYDVVVGGVRIPDAAWTYPSPSGPFEALRGHVAFYPQLLECYLDGERVRPQPGDFYGGWVTDDVRGPFKGEPGSQGW